MNSTRKVAREPLRPARRLDGNDVASDLHEFFPDLIGREHLDESSSHSSGGAIELVLVVRRRDDTIR